MRRFQRALWAGVIALVPAWAAAADVQGDYIEARNADVFTGPCFSNAEVFIYGDQAVLAWKVNAGQWNGVDVSGLCVAAAVVGDETFSFDRPEKAKAVLIVDSRADQAQKTALADMARTLGGERLGTVTRIATARMNLKLEDHATAGTSEGQKHSAHDMPRSPRASFWAAGLAQIVTRPLDEGDHYCGNEVVAYPPLSRGVDVQPAYTLGHEFKGEGLSARWDDPNCRSSFVGHFSY